MRTRACLRVALKTKRRDIGTGKALQTAIEERHMGCPEVGWQRCGIHGKTMILAGDQDLAGIEILDRVIGTMMSELHLHGLRTGRQGKELMTKANTEGRHPFGKYLTDCLDSVVTRLGITRTIGKKHAVGI